jgi:hypothetical protein
MLRAAPACLLFLIAACGGSSDAPGPDDGPDGGGIDAPDAVAPGTVLDRAPAGRAFHRTLDAARDLQQFDDGVRVGLTGELVASGTVLRGQVDGDLVVATQPPNQSVATPPRYCRFDVSTGQLDATFGDAGCVSAPRAYFSSIGIAKVPGGYRAIVERNCSNGCTPAEEAFGLIAISEDGVLDTAFGTEGILFSTVLPEISALDFAAQSTGDLVITGYTGLYQMQVFRIHADGSLDTTFGTAGFIPGANGGRIRVLADDSILLESTYNGVQRIDHYSKDGASISGFDLEELTDSTFDNDFNQTAADLDANGRLVIGYTRSDTYEGPEHHFVMRVLVTGERDASFTSPNLGDGDGSWIYGIGFDPEGRVLAGVGTEVVHLQP